MEKLTLSCPCHFGIEKTLKFEASRIGGENITVTDGRVTFEGGRKGADTAGKVQGIHL